MPVVGIFNLPAKQQMTSSSFVEDCECEGARSRERGKIARFDIGGQLSDLGEGFLVLLKLKGEGKDASKKQCECEAMPGLL